MEYYNKNISNVVSVCINDLNNNGYYNESYNFYPLVLFTQIVNGINFRLILAVQDAKSTNIRIFDYVVYSGFLNPNLTNIKIIKKNEIDYDSSYLDDKISNEKVKNAIAKFYYQKGKVEKYEIQYEFNTFNGLIGFKIYIVTVKVNYEENSKEENVIMVKREDKTFEVIAQLDME